MIQPPQIAIDHGHANLIWDPPSGMSAVNRWTCGDCGAAVLDYLGNIYGSATTNRCLP